MPDEKQEAWVGRVLSVRVPKKKTGGFGFLKTLFKSGKTKVVPEPPAPKQRFAIAQAQQKRGEQILGMMEEDDRKRVGVVLDKLDPDAEGLEDSVKTLRKIKRNYIYKALASDRSAEEIEAFFDRIEGEDEAWIQQNLHVVHGAGGKGLKQQWQMSCGPTTLQAFRAEMDPIYALKLHDDNPDYTKSSMFSGTSVNPNMAQEQKTMLDKHGTGSWARGSIQGIKGGGLELDKPLGEKEVKNHLGVSCTEFAYEDLNNAVKDLASSLNGGLPVPIRVESPGHFALAVGITGEAPDYVFSIHDPWAGKVVAVTAQQIVDKKLGFGGFKTLTHAFVPTVRDPSTFWPPSYEQRQKQKMIDTLRQNQQNQQTVN